MGNDWQPWRHQIICRCCDENGVRVDEEYCTGNFKLCNVDVDDQGKESICPKCGFISSPKSNIHSLREYVAMVFEKSTGLPDPNGRLPVQLSSKSEGKPISFLYSIFIQYCLRFKSFAN